MGYGCGDVIGALIRWLLRGCKTRLWDELNCEDGWFANIPYLGDFENTILAQCLVIIILIIVAIII